MGERKMKPDDILKLDPVIHAPIRLAIMSILVTVENANFKFLKDSTGTTDGNLSIHLTKLGESKLITIQKTFVEKKPQTICAITEKGREAFLNYLDQMEKIVASQREGSK
jgi:DNA-binding transcriptional ArsR family regulator